MKQTIIVCLLIFFSTDSFATLPKPLNHGEGRYAGEIIAPLNDQQIAAWCDFSKQIVVTKTNILCVYSDKNN